MTPRHRGLLLLALAAATAASLALRLVPSATPPPAETTPAGFWRLDLAGREAGRDEALARQLSLPYAAGSVRAEAGRTGVLAWAPDAAQPGWNLVVSGHGLEAVLVAMDGSALHRWRTTLGAAFPGVPPSPDSGCFRRAALLGDGSLLAIVQGMGMVKLDATSGVVWTRAEPLFNDLWVAPDESRILTLGKHAVRRDDLRPGEPILEDELVTLDAEGRVVARASLLDALLRAPESARFAALGSHADVLHSNTVEVLDGPGSAAAGRLAAGNLLVSFREIDTVALLDPSGRDLLWARRGPFRGQHEPTLLPDGRLLLFDNLGGPDGRSRVVAFGLDDADVETRFAGFAGRRFASPQAGAARRLGNGNLLVVASEQGVAWELTPAGEIAWEYKSPFRAGPNRELVAALFDVVRYETPTPFLASRRGAGAPSSQAP